MATRLKISRKLEEKMLDGSKTCFIRCEQYMDVGDTFEQFGANFRITKVEEGILEGACQSLWSSAGYDSYNDLVKTWIQLRGSYIPTQAVYIHWFEKIGG
jgi:hypothetical protein